MGLQNIQVALQNVFLKMMGMSYIAGSVEDENFQNARLARILQMVNKAKSTIKIAAGKGNARLYSASEFVKALTNALEKRVKVQIIVGPEPKDETNTLIRSLKSYPGFSAYQYNEVLPVHFFIVDGKAVRIQKPHSEDQDDREEVFFNNYKDAFVLDQQFEEYKRNANPL